jgi:hypothetical protein
MTNKPTTHPKPTPHPLPAPKSLPPQRTAKASRNSEQARSAHAHSLPAILYGVVLHKMLGEEGETAARTYAQDAITHMAPRDPVEELLVAQLLFTHARVMRLTALACQQTAIAPMGTLHEYADRASNTYRRLMLALAEYRRPPRTGDTFAIVKQANIGGQQVIQNHENSTRSTTNEQGSLPDAGNARSDPKSPPALPADADGTGGAACIGTTGEAVDACHRPSDRRRQSAITPERDEAR